MSKRKINGVLVIYRHDYAPIASMVMELVESFERHSRFKVWTVNTHLGFAETLPNVEFAVIVLHYSLFGWRPFYLDDAFRSYLAECDSSYKVAFFQDEYRWWPERAEVLNRLSVDCVYTCIEPEWYQETYWKYTKVPRLETYIPGYVSADMVQCAQPLVRADADRTIDIGYRGRRPFGYMGKGAREKHEIGVRFREMAAGRGLILDIESDEYKRIYGEEWLAFLANCRAVLGVEAGVSIFDIDDEIFPLYERFQLKQPDRSFEAAYGELLEGYDGRGIYYRTVSPRVFEAAAVRTCQIMYEGKYSGILEPMVHYIPLKKDFSNFEEVMKLYEDQGVRRELTENCHRDLIASEAFSYRRFIEKFDEGLISVGLDPGIDEGTARHVSELLAGCEQPRLRKYLDAQRGEHNKLFRKNMALEQQYMELQEEVAQLLATNPQMKAQWIGIEQGGMLEQQASTGEVPGLQTDALRREEQPSLVKQVEAHQADYQALLNNQLALQQQYMGLQRLLSEFIDRHPTLKSRRLFVQASKIASLLAKADFVAVRVYIGNVISMYPRVHRLAKVIKTGLARN